MATGTDKSTTGTDSAAGNTTAAIGLKRRASSSKSATDKSSCIGENQPEVVGSCFGTTTHPKRAKVETPAPNASAPDEKEAGQMAWRQQLESLVS